MKNIGVLVSGGGTNLQSVIDNIESGKINGQIKVVISNKESAYGLERARKHGIKAIYLNDEKEIIEELKNNDVDLVVLAGFLKILSHDFTRAFENKIINIHPSLIPSFCGKGYYGLKVHEAAVEYGVKVSGATVHFVDENTDTGAIIMQKTVDVLPDDSAQDLQKRVLCVEHEILSQVIAKFCEDKIKLVGRRVYIED
ncbi:Phosphoribosylglycinamide formyltransferase [Peptostreptococcus anaerobius]|uniref:Phosphoribosylglycinamide formyltransferase n=1 Tax=Peptostreptococcus anaerobius TaxID=1261 RepID=A0A379CEL0_9FIRM|nr:phosphoribosylglycinamide formyltransferase [Peptostreptococcus anaerobius]EKX92162.1 phosphoribosylglycinamide formyltransferase [Peptostreptococcus anaerobius VPI 4330 = DSM 2949]MDB8820959.1 phosphoribosylglycinamide formyltransferase [Peptostreptococcus anaerobius]MDB8826234.1 phosphoribosylglycinamide formyltransferase [Peptostreptococcus anaerobius]MDB8827326.1 phosphoribosylglycinamide formyltransferase [Peptostreptococcus anaerobius]MDB8829156.1 phosphoribosylglycinamide formyltrans